MVEEARLSTRFGGRVIQVSLAPSRASLPTWLQPLASFDRSSVFGLMDSDDGPEEFVFGHQ